jgi:ribosomal protein L37E
MSNGLERFAGRTLGVATLHGKEQVIGPPLLRCLSLAGVQAIEGVDTDRFGAFSGEVQRTADPLTTARLKAQHGAEVSGLDLVIASEGSFGPYPPAPFVPCDEEHLVLFDARTGTFFDHRHVSLTTVFGGELCATLGTVRGFAERMHFPEHQLVVRGKERWEPGDLQVKGIADHERLFEVAGKLIADRGSCWVETDMRAMANPTRMAVIAETAERFAKELATCCPRCGEAWFRITSARSGLPCMACGMPTQGVRSYVRTCQGCGHEGHDPRPDGRTTEDPMYCGNCNP